MNETITDVTRADYSILSAKHFFGGSDPIRIIILIYILLSIILNLINIITIIISKVEMVIENVVEISITIVNFIHTFSYLFEWVIKEKPNIAKTVEGENEVGTLLIGNPNNLFLCKTQAFLLISSSISQDFIINIFYNMIDHRGKYNKTKIKIFLILLGFVFPILYSLVYNFVGALGINDEFCYVTKFVPEINNNDVKYHDYEYFKVLAIGVYVVRFINFFYTLYLTIKIVVYIHEEEQKIDYTIKSIILPIVQLVTVLVGIIYRFSSLFSDSFSSGFSPIYLIINTLDGILFPLAFGIKNNIYKQFLKKINHKDEGDEDSKIEKIQPNDFMEINEEDNS